MPKTAKQHFDEDIARARNLVAHATFLEDGKTMLRDDILRSAWMFAVGAMDAYYCDAYADMIARLLRAKNMQPSIMLDEYIEGIKLPIGAVLSPTNIKQNWRWRMAARKMMERDNVLSLDKIQNMFNHFLRDKHKLFTSLIEDWITAKMAPQRLLGTYRAAYMKLDKKSKDVARKKAKEKLFRRFGKIIQRRHDCIHDCDRPKMRPQTIDSVEQVKKVIEDICFIVENCNEHFDREFKSYLYRIKCDANTMNALGY